MGRCADLLGRPPQMSQEILAGGERVFFIAADEPEIRDSFEQELADQVITPERPRTN